MTANELSTAMRSGQRVYGTLIVSTSPKWPEAVSGSGLDFVFIDTEHIPIGRETLSWMCRTYAAIGLFATALRKDLTTLREALGDDARGSDTGGSISV